MLKIFEGRLRTTNPTGRDTLEIGAENPVNDADSTGTCLDMFVSAKDRPEIPVIHKNVDLNFVHLGLASPDTLASDEVYPLIMKQNRLSKGEVGELISFLQDRRGDLFGFQEIITDYKVVDDLCGVEITVQYSRDPENRWNFVKGKQVPGKGRVQLWSSNHRPPQEASSSTVGQRESYMFESSSSIGPPRRDSSLTTTTGPTPRAISPISNPARTPEKAPQHRRFSFQSQVSTISEPDVSSISALSSIAAAPYAESVSSMSSMPSTRTTTNVTYGSSRASRPTSTRLSSVMTRVESAIHIIDRNGNSLKGSIVQAPDPPSLVLFQRDMLLVVDVTKDIKIDPELCDCQDESLDRARACTRVVLKSTRTRDILARGTGSGIPRREARPRESGSEWNLAAAGRFQKGSLGNVKHLRQLTLDFRRVRDRLQFVELFGKLQDLYLAFLRGMG